VDGVTEMSADNKAKNKKEGEEKVEDVYDIHDDVDDDNVENESIYTRKDVLTSGNPEIDEKMGGGIPTGTLSLIEGPNDCGKSVLTQQLLWGGAQQGFKIAIYTTENTIKSFLKQMDSLALDVNDFFLLGRLKIYPINVEGADFEDGLLFLNKIIDDLSEKPSELVIIDSLTVFVSHSSNNDILNFFAACKNLCDTGKTILLTVHNYAFEEEILTRVRSACDAHISLKLDVMGDKLIKRMEIAKIRGAQRTTGNIVSFEIEPDFGMRIIPFSRARA
jgi:flagellar protein FlaH